MAGDTRKIQKVGGSTYSVSLPKSWATARGLSAGSLVTVFARPDDALEVRPGDDADEEWTATVTVEHDDPVRIERAVRAAYVAGIDRLRLVAEEELTREQRRRVGTVTDTLPGSAVLEERPSEVVTGVLLDAGEVSLEQSVRQLGFVACSMFEAAATAVADEGEPPTDRHGEGERLLALVDRHVQRGLARPDELDALGCSRSRLESLRATAGELAAVAEEAIRLGRLASAHEDPAFAKAGDTEAFPDIAIDARSVVDDATAAEVGEEGVATARAALDARDTVLDRVADRQRSLLEDGQYRTGRVLDHCRRTAEHGGAIAALALRDAIGDGSLPACDGASTAGAIDAPLDE